ncbi:hypothetical protein X925_09455 [Petrotoga sp. 9T1HF07.CasAA.8.2]|uniref:type II secretion system F family protein n=1 Tax=Petrotoga sp. 9T1HF07.CasAA.8.2 TaxID=1434329 RepID=UPI000CA89E38|nr:type II secretion system F family protein [Petrotoga sp. 9T1HF07.CasAA.8.2]PNR87464.1 hypothetical protein X925_09455 [Petrotoga sp. 9T1HF07.CasAA.8.2]
MKKLYQVDVEERSSNKRYECLLLVKDKEEIYDILSNLNIRVININVDNFYFNSKKFNIDQMISLVDNLYLLVNSGLTLFEAMEFLVFNEQVDKFIRGVVFKGYFLVKKGLDYKTAFDFPEIDNYFRYTINISKTTLILRENLSNLKDYYNNVKLSRSTAEKSLIYPLLILSSILVLLFLLNFWVIPQFSTLLGYDINLNLSTYMLISMLIFFFFGLITFWIGKGNDIFWTKIPFLKSLYKNYILHEFTRNVNLLLKSGLTIYNALEIVLSNTNSQYISSTFLTAYLDIEKGKDLTEVFSKIKDVKEFSLTMSVSKRKGNYKEVFDFLENYYYSSFKTASDKIMKMIEPVLIIFLSVIILSLAFEIYSNVYLGGIKFEMGGTF